MKITENERRKGGEKERIDKNIYIIKAIAAENAKEFESGRKLSHKEGCSR